MATGPNPRGLPAPRAGGEGTIRRVRDRGVRGGGLPGAPRNQAPGAGPSRASGRVARCLRLSVLVAGFCVPALANVGARADGGLTTGTERALGLGRSVAGGPARSFGLGTSVFDSASEVPGRPGEPPPARFSLGLDALATEPVAVGFRWDLPVEPPLRPPPIPGEPLRGVRNASSSYGTKFLRGTLIITGIELASGVALALLPKQSSKWDDDALGRGGSNFVRAWTEWPVWDGDEPYHNWLGHPYAGALYYNMIRSQGGTVLESFAFAAFQSVMWEYVMESFAEQPSIQDLIATPIMGAVLGELFNRWSVAILRKGRLNLGQKALVFFLNPSYVINNGYRPPQ